MRTCGTIFLVLGMLLTLARAEEAKPAKPKLKRHLVFAHYMTCFTLDKEFCKHEIRIAQAHGIDGFAMDFGAWCKFDKDGNPEPTGYVQGMDNMFAAARELNTGFKMLLTPEWSVNPVEKQMPHMVKRYYDHPNAMRLKGTFCLSSYGQAGQHVEQTLKQLAEEGFPVAFVPVTNWGRHEMAVSLESALHILNQEYLAGAWRFVTDDTPRSMINSNANFRRAALIADKLYMAGISFYYNSSNVRDMRGMQGYGALWEGIIRDDADWVEIVTWNDYNEDTNLMHYKWKRDWDKQLYNRDGAYLDATAYYTSWYKSGRRPAITQDKLYFAYRDRSKWLVKAWDPKKEEWKIHTMTKWPFTQIHDDVRDYVYFSTFLTEPAVLEVRLGNETKTFEMPAGIKHAEMPMQPGVPRFVLKRGGETILDVLGRHSIIETETKENSPYVGHHLQSRIWAGGAVAGETVRVEAERGTLANGAETEDAPGGKTVFLPTREGAAVTMPVAGLKTAMYNIRVRYSNPHDYDRRLTLYADGVAYPQEHGERYRIPLWLPPTGEGNYATATVLWTLFDETTQLVIECNRSDPPAETPEDGKNKKKRKKWKAPKYGWNDTADVHIDAVELVRVTPMTFPQREPRIFPELVKIPGGQFTLGSKESSEKDELPAHTVTVSNFYIGKYEVTNEEFERFMSKHKQWRDGFSWRNREPVIYVDWREAARYCNWLSEQAGLTKVYDEKKWTADMTADGFRLPTEAEWEYVATGRGENRTYPWGNDTPVPMKHGNFPGAKILDVPQRVRSQEAQGVYTVGSFPAGASRDGVMDLAGNVSEWCADWYQLYDDKAQTDPLQTQSSHSRVIRGGSWGYYGYSQRSKDREFNSQSYPGYVYIGFRVALPVKGWQKAFGDK